MASHQEGTTAAETPVRDACRYLQERQNHLDYAAARHHKLPVGSGEIESAHRHGIQQRLKLSGAWWKETNLEPMLHLRVARANNLWTALLVKCQKLTGTLNHTPVQYRACIGWLFRLKNLRTSGNPQLNTHV